MPQKKPTEKARREGAEAERADTLKWMVRRIILMSDFSGTGDPLQQLVDDIRGAARRHPMVARSFADELKHVENRKNPYTDD